MISNSIPPNTSSGSYLWNSKVPEFQHNEGGIDLRCPRNKFRRRKAIDSGSKPRGLLAQIFAFTDLPLTGCMCHRKLTPRECTLSVSDSALIELLHLIFSIKCNCASVSQTDWGTSNEQPWTKIPLHRLSYLPQDICNKLAFFQCHVRFGGKMSARQNSNGWVFVNQ